MDGHRAWVGLGANLGDARATVRIALAALGRLPGTRVEATSRLRQTAPVGPPQPDYVNAAARLRTELSPGELLEALQALERGAGRRRDDAPRWGPRPLDLDLLLYEDRLSSDPWLTLPHPELHRRRFVLEPLCDLDPEWMHPRLDRTLRSLLQALGS